MSNTSARTRELVEFVDRTAFEDLPDRVIERAKLLVLDTAGSLLAAADPKYPAGRTMAEFAEAVGGREESTVVGYGLRTSPVNAALANGTMGYYCDIDAHHPEAITHTPAMVVPAALAVGEREGATGEEFLCSVVLGIEVACRVSLALNPGALYDQGFHPTPVAGGFGTAAAAGKLLGLGHEGYLTALGLAENQASGLLAWKGESTESFRPFNPGLAARNGVTAGLLADLEFGSALDPFEAEYDVFRAYSDGREHPERLVECLGEEYAVMDHAFKRYSCVAFSHPGLDGLLKLVDEHGIDAGEVDAIRLRFPETGAELIDGTDLRSHSAQYLLAVAAVDGEVTIDDILRDRRQEPAIRRLVERTEVIHDPDLDPLFPERYTSIVELDVGDETYSRRVEFAEGTPEKPFDYGEVEAKFARLTAGTVDAETRDRIVDLAADIEGCDDVRELGELLAYSSPAQ